MKRHTPPIRIVWILAASFLAALPAAAASRHHAAQQKPAAAQQEAAPANGPANDFPTLARVEYVLQCMQENGGQNYNTLYHCVCAVDKIASRMNYQDYAESLTFTYMFSTPGERGGEFRDPPRSEELRDKLTAAKKEAQETCFPAKPAAAGKK